MIGRNNQFSKYISRLMLILNNGALDVQSFKLFEVFEYIMFELALCESCLYYINE
jgi:hypothetical protein